MRSWLFRLAVPLAELQIDFQHVDKLFAGESTERSRNIVLQDLIDLLTDLRGIMLSVVSPLRSYPVQLKFGVCQCDVRVEAGTGSCYQVTGDVLKIGIGVFLAPHVEEIRLDV